jgi:hypothetical protein
MADKDIYLVPTNNIIHGAEGYITTTARTGRDYTWHKDNLD